MGVEVAIYGLIGLGMFVAPFPCGECGEEGTGKFGGSRSKKVLILLQTLGIQHLVSAVAEGRLEDGTIALEGRFLASEVRKRTAFQRVPSSQ